MIIIHIPNFDIFVQNRYKCKHASGGVALLVKQHLANYVDIIPSESDYVLWFKLKRDLMGINFLGAVVYVPPENSRYSDLSLFDELENDFTAITAGEDTHVCMAGDFNARTGVISDVLLSNDTIFNEGLLDFVTENVRTDLLMGDMGIPIERKSKDHEVNNYGTRLIEMCTSLGLCIANGRCGNNKNIGKLTCKNASVVDYVLASPNCFQFMEHFEVELFDSLLSDIHNHITITLSNYYVRTPAHRSVDAPESNVNVHAANAPVRPKWSPDIEHDFVTHIEDVRVAAISDHLDVLSNNVQGVSQGDVNLVVNDIVGVFRKAAKKSGSIRECKSQKKGLIREHCQKKPGLQRIAKFVEKTTSLPRNDTKSMDNKASMRLASKKYKKEINTEFNKYHRSLAIKLRKLKSTNPKDYWTILNGDKVKRDNIVNTISLDIFRNHFEALNTESDAEASIKENVMFSQNVHSNYAINEPFTREEDC